MKCWRLLGASLMLVAGSVQPAPASPPSLSPGPSSYAPHRVIVGFKPALPGTDAAAVRASLSAHVRARFKNIDAEVWDIGIDVDDAVKRLAQDPRVEYVEPDYLVHASAVFPNDPQFPQQWALYNSGQPTGKVDADIDAPEAWTTTPGATVLVGVIDSGIDLGHEDLKGVVFTNTKEIPGNGIDDDGNGYIDDVHGWDFINNDNDPTDDNGHGTHVSGIIAAPGNNGVGIAGVCWSARVLPLKFLSGDGSGLTSAAILALQYAQRMGARVVNLSWGSFLYSKALRAALADAASHGMLCIAASGNDGLDATLYPNYPASYPVDNMVSVGSTDRSDALSSFSDFGSNVDLAAPGNDILSAFPGNRYLRFSGTSMSCAMVSGAACLLWSRAPYMSATDVKAALLASVDKLPALNTIKSGGRLNLARLTGNLDAAAPAGVTTLAVDATASNSVRLAWTATGDDGNSGTASAYELRYATTPITAGTFSAAKLAAGMPRPLLAGSTQSFEVTGLSFVTTYYFALVAIDEAGNRSAISNLASATTLGVPALDVTPDALSATLFTGGTDTKTLTLSNTGGGTLDYSIPVAPAWVHLDPASGRIEAGQSRNVKVIFDAAHVAGGNYNSSVIVASNDPNLVNAPIAVGLHVSDAPDITVSTTLDFGAGFTGACARHDLIITNTGTDALNIGAIDVSELPFTISTAPFLVPPGESHAIPVFFCPNATGKATGALSIPSNDPKRPAVAVALFGRGVAPPVVSAQPAAITLDLYSGGTATRTITLSNPGGSDLDYSLLIPAPGSTDAVSGASSTAADVIATARPLARDALASLKQKSVPTQVAIRGGNIIDRTARPSPSAARRPEPSIADGNHLADVFGSTANAYFGAEIMRGNIFRCTATTNLKEYRFYLNPIEPSEMWFAVYVCDSRTGLYSLVGASDLTPTATGEGWYSSGDVNVRLLRNEYYFVTASFVKETGYFNQSGIAPFPIPASFGTLIGAGGWDYDPYAAFPPSGYQLVPDAAFDAPVAYYQTMITDGVVHWIAATPEQGTVRRGGATTVRVDIDTAELGPGDHDAVLRIASNDPLSPNVDIPIHVHVNGAPDIAMPTGPVDFGDCFTGVTTADTLLVSNAGTLFLNVTHLSCDDPAFTVSPSSLFLSAGQLTPVTVSFQPKSDGPQSAALTLTSNDPDEPVTTVQLRGTGRKPPHIDLASNALAEAGKPGESITHTISIVNSGESALNFELSTVKPGPSAPVGKKIVPGMENNPRAVSNGATPPTQHAFHSYSGHGDDHVAPMRPVLRSPQTTGARGLKVLVLFTGEAFDLIDALQFYPDIALLDPFDAELDTPTLADLAPYDVILMYNNFPFKDPKAVGDVLADYVDGGGTVVITLAAFIQYYDIQGRFVTGGYLPFEIGTGPAGTSSLGDYDKKHPMFNDVVFIVGDQLGNTNLVDGARLLATWRDGRPFIATTRRGQVVGMNIYLGDGGWGGDVPVLIHNALKWVTGPRWLRAWPPSGLIPPHQHADVTVTFDGEELRVGNYSAVLRVTHNDPLAHDVEIPVSFAVDTTTAVTGVGNTPVPARYALEANHPNPFNPETMIAYDLAGAGKSRLVVYDVSGARIRELVDTNQRAGHYTVTWDGRDDSGAPVASGVYFYRLTSGPFNQTRKMVLLK